MAARATRGLVALGAMGACMLAAAGCGARSELVNPNGAASDGEDGEDGSVDTGTSSASFPLGTFSNCARGIRPADASAILGGLAWLPGASLSIASSGSAGTGSPLRATYVDENGARSTFDFVATSGATASLASSAHVGTAFGSLCVVGPGSESFGRAEMTASSGALVASGHTVFLLADGVVDSAPLGTCPARSAPASLWIACTTDPTLGDGAPAAALVRDDAAAEAFPVGSFVCHSQVGSKGDEGAVHFVSADGGDGSLVLAREGAAIDASYTDDRSIGGTMRFVVATPTSAQIDSAESVTGRCSAPPPGGPPPLTSTTIAIDAGTLAYDGTTLFLSIAGASATGTSGPCATASWVTTMECTRP